MQKLQKLRDEIRSIIKERNDLQIQIEKDIEQQNSNPKSLFSSIRLFFNEIFEEVIDRKVILSIGQSQGNKDLDFKLEFKAEILDESGNTTSADLGHTYRKLLCIAFDLAVLRSHLSSKFPRFVFHDGVFESLDDRKKEKLLEVIRRYAELGIQPIITLIDSDLPKDSKKVEPIFNRDEIILTLHDESEQGRLFKMQAW